jgi:hypothetical protein
MLCKERLGEGLTTGQGKLSDIVRPSAGDDMYHRAEAGDNQQEEVARTGSTAWSRGILG